MKRDRIEIQLPVQGIGDVIVRPVQRHPTLDGRSPCDHPTLRHLGYIYGTVHCRDEDPERCAREIAAYLDARYGAVDVGLIGLNPAIADRLIERFGPARVRITDLDPARIGERRSGVKVWDGATRTAELIDEVDVVLVSGTTLANDTFDPIIDRILARQCHYLVFGVTAAGVCELVGLPRICPCGRNE